MSEKRSKTSRGIAVGLSASVLAGGAFLMPKIPIGVEGVAEAAPVVPCLDGPTRPSTIEKFDTTPLPPLTETQVEDAVHATQDPAYVGRIIINGRNAMVTMPPLPAQYEQGMESAINDPYVGCVMTHYGVAINFEVAPASKENGYFHGELGKPETNKIDILFGDGSNQERLYKTSGAEHAILTHENTHGVFQDWENRVDAGDKFSATLMESLNADYTKDTQAADEEYRQTYANSVKVTLDDMLEHSTDTTLDMAVIALEVDLDQQHGLDAVATYCPARMPLVCENQMPGDMLASEYLKAKQDLGDTSSLDQNVLKKIHEVMAPEDGRYFNFMKHDYPDSDESETMPNVVGSNSGHPFDNPNERIASSVASDNLNPEQVKAGLEEMSSERRNLAKDMRSLFVKFLQHTNPGLLRFMKTPDIAK